MKPIREAISMDKIIRSIIVALSLAGGFLVASEILTHLSTGITVGKQAYVGGALVAVAVCLHLIMDGRLIPWQR